VDAAGGVLWPAAALHLRLHLAEAPLPAAPRLRRILIAYSCERNYWNYNRLEDVGEWPCRGAATACLALPAWLCLAGC
jgi:hypothetical protein